MDTVWVLGDQLNRRISSLADRVPADTRILMIESRAKLASKPYHRQRLHLVLAGMRRFADELRKAGFHVDYRHAQSFREGLDEHRAEFRPHRLLIMEPMSFSLANQLPDLGIEVVKSNQFLCHYADFADWAQGRKRLVMEDFYRWQRRRLGYLMDEDEPAGGRWNFDVDNRQPPPSDGRAWPAPVVSRLDDLDRDVIADLPETAIGACPSGIWATSRRAALRRLSHFVDNVLPIFGPHEDAMLDGEWKMAHSTLSPYLNLGLLHPAEVCDAAETAYREGKAPIESVEGFIRQVIGWREYVWGIYWQQMPAYAGLNSLEASRQLPPLFRSGETHMRCVAAARGSVDSHGYAHHIQRLMILGNLALLGGVVPQQMVDWMWASFVDGAEWVMLPNVIGMSLYADGGLMASKPYAAGGNYIDRMSDHCGKCIYDPKSRVGDEACPFTTLYWDFLDRNATRLAGNHRIARQLKAAERLGNIAEVRARAAEVLAKLDDGDL